MSSSGEQMVTATDWERFPNFYAEYFAKEQEFEIPSGGFAAVGPITYTGKAAIQRDIANLKAAVKAEGVEEGFLPVVAPASCFPNLIDEHYGSEKAAIMGVAEALREE
jgi:5-methyltetrahydropteroyltriglutamate--homocysteine methyltransferase